MSTMKNSVCIIFGVLCVLILLQRATSQLCPQCLCKNSYSPVCSENTVTGKLRGFSSHCVLDCTNKCRNNRFKYLGPGRCGQYTSTTARTTESTRVTTPIPYRNNGL